jgi:putative aldouronate transport system permease protein
MKKNHQTPEDNIFDGIVFAFSLIIFIIMAYPMWFIVIASFSDSLAVSAGKVWFWPANFTTYGYEQVFANSRIWIGYRNTVIYAVSSTILNLLVTMPAAYAISRRDLKGRKLITLFFVFTVYFSGGLVPTYLTARAYGLVNTFWVLIIPFGISWSNLIVSRAYFSANIPDELLEAARIDGCGNTRFFVFIVLPLSKAIVAVIALYVVVGQWNSWFQYLVYVRKESLVPLQIVLRDILLVNTYVMDPLQDVSEQMRYREILKYSLIIVATLPVMCFYPFIQKYFTKGVMIGAIKG